MMEIEDIAAKQREINRRLNRLEGQVDGLLAVRLALVALVDAHDLEPRIVTETEWANARISLGRPAVFDTTEGGQQ